MSGLWKLYKKGATISREAFTTGHGCSEPIYVARVLHRGCLLPGYAKDGVGYFVYKGEVVTKEDEFEILHGDFVWVSAASFIKEDLPPPALRAGRTFMGVRTFVGMALVNGLELCGQVIGGACHIAVDESEVVSMMDFSYLLDYDGDNNNECSDSS
ncbi:Hypothetical predicted protein [Cloeon dipterum]|uniref:Uncharacterized protein n=1 Tax=Cloeon dipterum TaxID=197152 RepID=A0A8S1DVW8_9INSE|nr:Hypothetical predicted protein [Cloeon dipterum]